MLKHNVVPRTAARPWAVAAKLMILIVVVHAAVVGCGGAKTEGGAESGSTPPATSTEGASATGAGTDTAAAPTVASVDAGAKVYAQRCALCHGASGKGDGAAAAGLNPKPRDHTDGAYMKSRTDEDLLGVIRNGKGTMPAWGAILSETELQSVLMYVRTLAK